MVDLRRMAVTVISHARHVFNGEPPEWAVTLESKIDQLTWKVNLIMALDATVLNRILAGAGALVDQNKTLVAALSDAKDKIASLESQEAAEDVAEQNFMDSATQTADAMDALLKGPDTPTVETPAPSDAPGVIDGTTDPVVTDPGPSGDTSEAPPVASDPNAEG